MAREVCVCVSKNIRTSHDNSCTCNSKRRKVLTAKYGFGQLILPSCHKYVHICINNLLCIYWIGVCIREPSVSECQVTNVYCTGTAHVI